MKQNFSKFISFLFYFSLILEVFGDSSVSIIGRFVFDSKENCAIIDWPGVYLQFNVSSTQEIWVEFDDVQKFPQNKRSLEADTTSNIFQIIIQSFNSQINITSELKLIVNEGKTRYQIASNLDPSQTYSVSLYKRTEALSIAKFYRAIIDGGINLYVNPESKSLKNRKLEFIGDSVVAGYGDECKSIDEPFSAETEDVYLAYGPVVSRYFDADYFIEAISGIGVVRNYGDPNKTSARPFGFYMNSSLRSNTSEQYSWDYSKWQPDAMVLHLGGNDYSTLPHPDDDVFIKGYRDLISHYRYFYGDIPMFITTGPMYGDPVKLIQEIISLEQPNVYFVNWTNILTPDLEGCQTHPNVEAHAIMSNILIKSIQQVLGW
eukprot:Anaeramoba_ignava/c20849_g1_i1.p1 GENE.c20849_g1_i1~~c20849_g1_i1.p1  ORF type:complete len:375 (+),score=111.70 c20849_g1_i1:3-1127(+)